MKSQLVNEINRLHKVVNFGINDRWVREIGAEIFTSEVDFVEKSEDANMWYLLEPGHYYRFVPHATRNGNGYGAIQPYQYFKTETERQTAIDKYLTNAKKRASKI